jgi:integrase
MPHVPLARVKWDHAKLVRERDVALGNALMPSTNIGYRTAYRAYQQFVSLHGFPLKPSIDNFSFFITWMCHYVTPDTANKYLTGICNRMELMYPDVRAIRCHPIVSRTLAGCRRMYGGPQVRKRALLISDLEHAFEVLDSSIYDNRLFLTLLSVGFFSLQRLGELVEPDRKELRSYRKLPVRHSLRFGRDDSTFEYTLPTHKADPTFKGNTIFITFVASRCDPVASMREYIKLRDSRHSFLPELWLRESGKRPSRSWFLSILKKLFPDPDISGHSLRAGGATYLATEGVPEERIQRIGRWSSNAFQIYIREHPMMLHLISIRERANRHSNCTLLYSAPIALYIRAHCTLRVPLTRMSELAATHMFVAGRSHSPAGDKIGTRSRCYDLWYLTLDYSTKYLFAMTHGIWRINYAYLFQYCQFLCFHHSNSPPFSVSSVSRPLPFRSISASTLPRHLHFNTPEW